IRSIRAAGIWLMSEKLRPSPKPGPRRRPFTRTTERCGPNPRRLIVAVPSAPLDTVEFWAANTIGKLLRMSSALVRPVAWMSLAETVLTGLMETRLGDWMRDPVTTTSVTAGAAPCWAWSCAMTGAPTDVASALKNSARRTAWLTRLLELDIDPPANGRTVGQIDTDGSAAEPTSICSTVFCDTWSRWGRSQGACCRYYRDAQGSGNFLEKKQQGRRPAALS